MIKTGFKCDCGGSMRYNWRLKAKKCKRCGEIIKIRFRPYFCRECWVYPRTRVINGNGQIKIKQDLFLIKKRFVNR